MNYILLSHTISLISSPKLQYMPLFIGNNIRVFHNLACLPCCIFNLLSYFQYWPGNYLHSRRPSLSFLLTYLTQEIWCSIHLTTSNCTTAFCKRRNNLQSVPQTMPLFMQGTNLLNYYCVNLGFILIYYLFNFGFLMTFICCDICIWFRNYALFLWTSVFLLRLATIECSRTIMRTAQIAWFFVCGTNTSRAWLFGVTLISDSVASRRCQFRLRSFLCSLCARAQRTWRAHNST